MNLSLYLLTVLIWGTTWIALKLQLGVVAIPVSIVYRSNYAKNFIRDTDDTRLMFNYTWNIK